MVIVARRHTRRVVLVLHDRFVMRPRPQRNYTGLTDVRDVAAEACHDDRAVAEEADLRSVAEFDDRRLSRIVEIMAGADHEVIAAQGFECVEERIDAPVHAVVAGERNHVEPRPFSGANRLHRPPARSSSRHPW